MMVDSRQLDRVLLVFLVFEVFLSGFVANGAWQQHPDGFRFLAGTGRYIEKPPVLQKYLQALLKDSQLRDADEHITKLLRYGLEGHSAIN